VASIARTFRVEGVKLAAAACTKALNEACLSPSDITHVVTVTCTDQSNPGYDLFVSQTLCLSPNVQRVLLQGVGCAGGLSALRTAADIAAAASQKGRPARVLVIAMELFSLYLQAELQAALRDPENLHVASVLFSDAAAALVVCNGLALGGGQQKPVFELREWGSMVVPETADFMSYDMAKNGMSSLLMSLISMQA
jgi:type III polyketide synthase